MLTTAEVVALARKHLATMKTGMVSSAALCLADAEGLLVVGNASAAKARALKSLAYSVGIFHPDYCAANA